MNRVVAAEMHNRVKKGMSEPIHLNLGLENKGEQSQQASLIMEIMVLQGNQSSYSITCNIYISK